jgi:hypothetical protein
MKVPSTAPEQRGKEHKPENSERSSPWESNNARHKLFAQNENDSDVANSSFANVKCVGKVLVRGPRTSPVQKDS